MTPAQSSKLQSCYISPTSGVAFFDGITIRADSITDIRQNVVFPVMEEKQVYVCRQMKALLEKSPNSLFLDVGTGSGVYAIYAAAVCNCKVIAVETSARALRIARQNAKANGVTIAAHPQELEAGEIYFSQVSFGEKFIEKMKNKYNFDAKSAFDFVLLSPANMLSMPNIFNISIAKHAFGGKDGQQPFLEQIKYVPSVLKFHGHCIGTQMTPVITDGLPQASTAIDSAFDRKCHIKIKEVFGTKLPTQKLLQGQYKSFLEYLGEDRTVVDRIHNYIDEISRMYPDFMQIYYEIKKKRSRSKAGRHTFIPFDKNNIGHMRGWEDRIYVYRNIVDYSSPKGYFPTPSVFTKDFAGNLISAKNLYKKKSQNTTDIFPTQTPLALLDTRLKRHATQQGKGFLFDALVIEVVPIFTTQITQQDIEKNIEQECKVWIFDRKDSEQGANYPKNIQKTAKKLLKIWQASTKGQQKAMMGSFFHPSFIGTISPDQWGQIYHSTLSSNISLDRARLRKILKYKKRLEAYCQQPKHSDESQQEEDIEIASQLTSMLTVDESSMLTVDESVPLNDLGVPGVEKYCKDLIAREHIEERIPGLANQKILLQQIESQEKKVIDFLVGRKPLEENRELWNEVLAEDIQLCHQAWHQYITKQFSEIAYETGPSAQGGFSSLISFPLFIQNASSSIAYSGKLLEKYRGGVWIYAASSDDWTLKHEQYLYDIAKLILLLCVEQYALIAPKKSAEKGEKYRSKLLGHEVKHVASAMSNNWVRPVEDFFDIGPYEGEKPSGTKKIGRIEIWDDRFLKPPWNDSLGITPFRNLIGSAGQLISFWCLLDNPADVPFSDEPPPKDLRKFIENSWKWAVDTVAMHAFSRENPCTAKRAVELQKVREAIQEIHKCPALNLEGVDFPEITWDVDATSSSKTVWLCRLFVTLFTNCVKHSDPTKPVKLTIKHIPKAKGLYTIIIDDYKGLGASNSQLIKEKLLTVDKQYETVADVACAFLEKAKYKLEYLDDKLNLSTREVVSTCLDNLSGTERHSSKDIKWPDREVKPGDNFCVEIMFRYN